jgi:conjugative relaxase-like TrwC/TraI family protein
MLRITTQSNAAAAKAYFQPESHDYYLNDHEPPGEWGGRLAKQLGLEPGSQVDQEQFERLCDNRHPLKDEQLTAANRSFRRVFNDFTWSMPKSATLASLIDDRIFPVFIDSVRRGMERIEEDLQARVRVNGADEDRTVGNGCWALFAHSTTRPIDGVPDPQRHVHATLFNAVFDSVEKKTKAAQIGAIKSQAGYYEALVMNDFASRLVGLGYGIRRRGRYFEIQGVSDAMIDKFCNRTKLIEDVAEARGITDPKRKAELGGKTRESKESSRHGFPELKQLWLDRLTAAERDRLEHLPEPPVPLPDSEAAMAYAIRHAFERDAVVNEKRLHEHALRFGVGGVDPKELRAAGDAAGLIVRDGRTTTRDMLEIERGLIRTARDGRNAKRPLVANPPVDLSSLGGAKLNAGQKAAVRSIWSSTDTVALLRGAAGVGKTTALAVAAAGIREAGHRVQALALTNSAKDELAKAVDPNAATLQAFLGNADMQEQIRGGVVILDEASQVPTRMAAELTRTLDGLGARAVWVGDINQHGAVESGAPFRALQQYADLPVTSLTDIVRQTHAAYRRVVSKLADHRVAEALEMLDGMGWVHEMSRDERLQAIAAEYLQAVQSRHSVLVVAPSHAECNQITEHLRVRLKAEGIIHGQERAFETLKPLNLTEAERHRPELLEGTVALFHRKHGERKAGERVAATAEAIPQLTRSAGGFSAYRSETITLAEGDTIRTTASVKDRTGQRIVGGTVLNVTGFTAQGDIRVKTATNLDRILPADVGMISHAICTTSYSSQSRSMDVVIAAISEPSYPATGLESAYVALSRGRQRGVVFTDDKVSLREAIERSQGKSLAHDLIGEANEQAARRDHVMFMQRLKEMAMWGVDQIQKALTGKERDRGLGYA